ncbi:hypothetical protein ACWD6Z_15215, partial [Streptomyces californicus]
MPTGHRPRDEPGFPPYLRLSASARAGHVPPVPPAPSSTTAHAAPGRAARLARTGGVIVKRLPALHDLGAVDVLCLDKT